MLLDKISSSCYRSSLIIRTCHVESGICTLSSRPCSLTLTRFNEISPGGASANRAQSLSRGDHYRIIAPAKINFARRAVRIREIPGKYQYRINYHVPVRYSTKASGEIGNVNQTVCVRNAIQSCFLHLLLFLFFSSNVSTL